MLHPKYLREGLQVRLPEVSVGIGLQDSEFTVRGVHFGGTGQCLHLIHQRTESEFALKSVRPDLIGETAASSRFYDELRVWLSASACNLVVEAIAVVRIDNMPAVVARWMSGGDLSTHLARMGTPAKLEILLRVVRALSWAQRNLGVIHRDLKPGNILLDADGLAFVGDWGLARPAVAAVRAIAAQQEKCALDRPDRTQTGAFVGTILYAAPEQIVGLEGIDHRADIYSLGCLMYEMETGRPPFLAESAAQIAALHLAAKPPAVGGLLSRGVLGLSKTIVACLAKEPRARPQSYHELESAVLKAMALHGGDSRRCPVQIRYERTILGQGHEQQSRLLDKTFAGSSSTLAVVEFEEIYKYLQEASNLMGIARYREAAELLRPLVIQDATRARRQLRFAINCSKLLPWGAGSCKNSRLASC